MASANSPTCGHPKFPQASRPQALELELELELELRSGASVGNLGGCRGVELAALLAVEHRNFPHRLGLHSRKETALFRMAGIFSNNAD